MGDTLAEKAYLLAKNSSSELSDVITQSTVTEATNTFTCDLSLRNNFAISISNTNAKTLTFSNIPSDLEFTKPIIIKLSTTAVASITTYPTGTVWSNGEVPTYEANKTYYLTFIRITNGWHSMFVGGF